MKSAFQRTADINEDQFDDFLSQIKKGRDPEIVINEIQGLPEPNNDWLIRRDG